MSSRLLGWLTINQMLFISHLILVVSIIFGMSYSRYQNDWTTKIEHLADISASHLEAYNTFFSGSVAGRNYANLLMQSTLDNLKAVPNLLFAEVSGVSDYSGQKVAVRYSLELSKGWRLDVTEQDKLRSKSSLKQLRETLANTPASNTVQIKKLNYLINKVTTDLDVITDNIRMQSLVSPIAYDKLETSHYYLDENTNLLHIQVALRNKNGGLFRAVVNATELKQLRVRLINNIVLEAMIAIIISFLLIFLVTYWLVSPLKGLAASMKQDIEKIDQSKLPEIKRSDEIGELARAYSSLITRIKNQLRILHHQTETDPLTGMGSRLKYQNHAARFVQHALLHDDIVYIALCDIDNFKRFNDTYGHIEGDNTLTEVANQMSAQLKPQELGCRIGGEEFICILSGKDDNQLKQRVEALGLAVYQLNIPHSGNTPHSAVTISIGAAKITRKHHTVSQSQAEKQIQSAMKVADEQLYVCKKSGRNRVLFSSEAESSS